MVEFFIAFRHILERKFQSIFSVLGVSIAMTVFVVSLTISNGLERNTISSLLTLSPHILIKDTKNFYFENYEELKNKIEKIKNVKRVIPQVNTQSIIKYNSYAKGVLVKGIAPENIKNDLNLRIVKGTKDILELNSILIGEELSKEMKLEIGDELSIVSSENKEIKLVVRGIFKTGFLDYDINLVILPLKTIQILNDSGEIATDIGVQVENPKNVDTIINNVNREIKNEDYKIMSWKVINQNLLNAVVLEKFILISILSLLLIIASFTVSVILNMIVREKTKDIGILKSVGYTNNNIRKIFIIEGMIISIIGMIIASILVPLILIFMKEVFKNYMSSYYYLEKLPLYITLKEIVIIYIVTLLIVFLSTIYPATRAAKMKPVEALKYE